MNTLPQKPSEITVSSIMNDQKLLTNENVVEYLKKMANVETFLVNNKIINEETKVKHSSKASNKQSKDTVLNCSN